MAAAAAPPDPTVIQISIRPFPWPATSEDLGAASAAAFLNLLLVFAFLAPTRAAVAAVVREKELRLREGMRVLGEAPWGGVLCWAGSLGRLCRLAGTWRCLLVCAVSWLSPRWHQGALRG